MKDRKKKTKGRILAWFICAVMVLSTCSYTCFPESRAYAAEDQSESVEDENLTSVDKSNSNLTEEKNKTTQENAGKEEDKSTNSEEEKEQQNHSAESSEETDKEEDSDNRHENSETDVGSTDSEDETNSPEVLNTGDSITLNLAGGTLADAPDWNVSADGSYTYTIPDGSAASLTLPIPTRTGYTFGGWKKADDTVIVYNKASGIENCTLDPSEVTKDVTLTAVWQKYSIDITKATYTFPPADGSSNTLMFTHYNKDGESLDMQNDILPFLGENVTKLSLDYIISYDDNGSKKEITRTNVSLSIEWNWNGWNDGQNPESNEDFREVVNYLETDYNGDTRSVYLSDNYLKQLIAEYESSQYAGDEKVSDMTKENIAFPKWGIWNASKQQYVGEDIDITKLKIKLGSSYNKDSGISGNENYLIDTVSPSNVQVNLFDYWQSSSFYSDLKSDTYTSKLNQNHGLIFKYGNVSGTWNNWTGAGADVRPGIVQNLLADGFPLLNLLHFSNSTDIGGGTYDPNESLQYLFDPDTVNKGDYGRAYSNVDGLFKINENGNYYYSSHDNFAEYDYDSNSFNVYNAGGVIPGGSSPHGQFFPFNTADQVFKLNNGQLADSGIRSTGDAIDHYLGLSMSVEFQQPIDGMVSVGDNAKPMTFEFSGDDDVWIFIDDVLVADLGGIHDEASVEIDFSTGEITRHLTANAEKNVHNETIKQMFDEAGKTGISFNGNTFAGNTTHTLKLFYLERGNYDSNLTLSFNLMEPIQSQIIKLDQDGEPVENAKFALYKAALEDKEPVLNEDGTYETVGDAIISSLQTDENGKVNIPATYDFSQNTYYVLREEKAPDGYFGPGDVLLRYDKYEKHSDGTSSGTNLLLVDNRWTTGAVGNFSATIYQSGDLHYDGDANPIDPDTGQKGLILAVPMMKGSDGNWRPLYGSNMAGFETVSDTDERSAVLKAALYQIFGTEYGEESEDGYSYGFQKWYMEWNEEMDRYQGVLNDLPGDATRYYWASGKEDADMSVAYYFLDLEKLTDIFGDITGKSGEQKLSAIANKIHEMAGSSVAYDNVMDAVNNIASQVLNKDEDKSFGLLDVSLFNRTFGSRIYVPNTQPDLRVLKLDQDGNPIQNVEFSLYGSEDCSGTPLASGKTDDQGLLIFSETADGSKGSAMMSFEGKEYYYLKETTPEGYDNNEKVIPVYVTEDGRVYANALDKDDGITVRKGLGKLVQTMAKYAGSGSIDGTLRDITGKLFTVNDFNEINNAIRANTGDENGEELDFCYGATNALLEYGTHEINGVYPNPYFEVDEGIAGIIVHQNYDAHQGDILYDTYAQKTHLESVNIRGLFTGSTTVVVRNRKTDSKGSFSIKKTVSGTDILENQKFRFEVTIDQNEETKDEIDTSKNYSYTVKNKSGDELEAGTIKFTGNATDGWKINSATKNGDNLDSNYFADGYIQLQADEMITVTGIPFGLKITAKESEESATGYQTSVSVNNGQWDSNTEASGIVEKPVGNPSFVFNNHKDRVTNLELKKVVATGETDKKFTFNITLTNASGADLTGSYNWKVQDENGNDLSDEGSKGIITDGKLQVSLKDGETVVIYGIPIDSKYMITEDTMGYSPAVMVNDVEKQVVNGSVSGTIEERHDTDGNIVSTEVVYTNVRSGSITITKRTGAGTLLNGAGFTLYSVDDNGERTEVRSEQKTALAVKKVLNGTEEGLNLEAMRYSEGTSSYIVHKDKDSNNYFYYCFLNEQEKNAYYNGTFEDQDKVEAIVEFDGITDFTVKYMIVETTVPDGYVQSEDIKGITLPKNDGSTDYYDLLYTVTNHKQLILPTSGLTGIGLIIGIGVILVGAAIVLLRIRKHTKMR